MSERGEWGEGTVGLYVGKMGWEEPVVGCYCTEGSSDGHLESLLSGGQRKLKGVKGEWVKVRERVVEVALVYRLEDEMR